MSDAVLRLARAALVVVGSAAVVSVLAVYGVSEWKLDRVREAPAIGTLAAAAPTDAADGQRLARILGCWAGCHGAQGQGGTLDMDGYYTVTAPTLSSVMPLYSDAQLARLVRFGIKRDGRSALGMTSYTFFPLAATDLAHVTAHLRRQPRLPPVTRTRTITWSARLALVRGKWRVAADQVDRHRPRWGELPRTDAFERGRYLASVTCSECHGVEFRGNEFADNTADGGPSLAIVAAYGQEEFRRLLRTGASVSGRDLGEMSWVARNAFLYFTDQEIDDLRAFLRKYHGLEPQ